MKTMIIGLILFIGVLATFTTAVPVYEEELQPHQFEPYEQYQPHEEFLQVRERRSPQQNNPPPPNRGSIGVTGGHTSGQGGFVRGDYNHKLWEGRNGARLDANTYYQRNWGSPGPRQDYGGGVKLSVPFGGR